jgi:hypothetical protein
MRIVYLFFTSQDIFWLKIQKSNFLSLITTQELDNFYRKFILKLSKVLVANICLAKLT